MARDSAQDPSPYGLRCLQACGVVFVNAEAFRVHMPGSPWRCPACLGAAEIDPECRYAVFIGSSVHLDQKSSTGDSDAGTGRRQA